MQKNTTEARKHFARRCAFMTALACVACGSDEPQTAAPGQRQAEIRRTDYGVAHITAPDLAGLGFGQGYVEAEDHACLILDQIVRLREMRSRTFGPGDGDANIASDLAVHALGIQQAASAALAQQSDAVRSWLDGFAAGFDEYLRTQHSELPEACAHAAAAVSTVTTADIVARAVDVSLLIERGLFSGLGAQPPQGSSACAPAPRLDGWDLASRERARPASNGWALGSARTESGRGMLLANPHLPLEGELRLHEVHLTIPGQLDAYGAGLVGLPGIMIGFNQNLAWTHTVSASLRTLLYRLALDPSDPTRYRWNGEYRALDRTVVKLDVLRDGAIKSEEHTLYSSIHGPVIAFGPLAWSSETAYALSSTSLSNAEGLAQILAMMQSSTLDEFIAAHRKRGVAWATTECASRDGRVVFLDASRVPALPDAVVADWKASTVNDLVAMSLAQSSIALLDGSSDATLWRAPGDDRQALVPFEQTPQLQRDDYVVNANESYWLANASAPQHGYSPLFGSTDTPIFARTRMNLFLLDDPHRSHAAGDDGRFSLDEAQAAVLGDRGMLTIQLLPELVARCRATSHVSVAGADVDLSEACEVLANWDGTQTGNAPGAVLFREFLGDFSTNELLDRGPVFEKAFDPAQPITTPAGMRPTAAGDPSDRIALALAHALQRLSDAGMNVRTTTLADAQFIMRGDQRVGVHGCLPREGCLNVLGFNTSGLDTTRSAKTPRGPLLTQTTGLAANGYPANFGSTFVLVAEFTDQGPRARAIMTYGQSSQPSGDALDEQLDLWRERKLRDVVFDADAVRSATRTMREF